MSQDPDAKLNQLAMAQVWKLTKELNEELYLLLPDAYADISFAAWPEEVWLVIHFDIKIWGHRGCEVIPIATNEDELQLTTKDLMRIIDREVRKV